jgi:hypothetical protein
MAAALVMIGLALLVGPRLVAGFSSDGRVRVLVVAAVVGVLFLAGPAARAHHDITTSSHTQYTPYDFNGYRVYLSSARHQSSGSRGECGWEENRNARNWNMYAAYHAGYGPVASTGLHFRHYYTQVSPNDRPSPDGTGATANKNASNNWGANLHLVTHTNANVGCGDSASYLLVMHRSNSSNSVLLKDNLMAYLAPFPGGENNWDCDGLTECANTTAAYRAYVELFFHTNQSAVNTYQGGGTHGVVQWWSGFYANAIDNMLGYPRA